MNGSGAHLLSEDSHAVVEGMISTAFAPEAHFAHHDAEQAQPYYGCEQNSAQHQRNSTLSHSGASSGASTEALSVSGSAGPIKPPLRRPLPQ